MHRGVPIDFRYEDKGMDATVVFFHAALGPKVKSIPVFLGRSFSQHLPVNRLFVADPSLSLNESLRLAWYAGNYRQPDLQVALEQIIQFVTRGKRTIYFGASGGGFAALSFSAIHAQSLAIPVNPQTSIGAYLPQFVTKWSRLCWHQDWEPGDDLQGLPAQTDLTEVYASPRKNHVLYIQNTQDSHHMKHHWLPYSHRLASNNHVIPILEPMGEGHVPPKPEQLALILEGAVSNSNWSNLTASDIAIDGARTVAQV